MRPTHRHIRRRNARLEHQGVEPVGVGGVIGLQRILAVAPAKENGVGAGAGVQHLITSTTVQGVIARTPQQGVVAVAPKQLVVSKIPAQHIVARQAVDAVVAAQGVEEIFAGCTRQQVIALRGQGCRRSG